MANLLGVQVFHGLDDLGKDESSLDFIETTDLIDSVKEFPALAQTALSMVYSVTR